ncbi:MAG: IPTL-CTERM sorting domain-containing protein [Burkholderiales bacterium]|nr:IPTL-CTERM sorting domain-containing protein [Burkholderiales bacterium]
MANIAANHDIVAMFGLRGRGSGNVTGIPALNETMLVLLALMLVGMAGLRGKGRGW